MQTTRKTENNLLIPTIFDFEVYLVNSLLTADINGKNPSVSDVNLSFALNYLRRKVRQVETMSSKTHVPD